MERRGQDRDVRPAGPPALSSPIGRAAATWQNAYLNHSAKTATGRPMRLIDAAQHVQDHMPGYIVRRIEEAAATRGLTLDSCRVLLVGITYKAGVADIRQSPAHPIAELLLELGATVQYYDELVTTWTVNNTAVPPYDPRLPATDIAVLLQHDTTDYTTLLSKIPIVLDTRGRHHGPKTLPL
ncbi:UDP binding domain-containing protein [Nocardia carnea]|uniref:UDP binding domain-containing protein n=1 Tax=Nocardia carnea TaxID=37328 RepID=UPI002457E5FE|nr:UDP binding domain-containing protein [Nocardia carnea]